MHDFLLMNDLSMKEENFPDECDICNSPITVKKILLECPLYLVERMNNNADIVVQLE